MSGASNGQVIRRMNEGREQEQAALATAIGQQVAQQLAPLLGQLLASAAAATQPTCFFCCGQVAAHAEAFRAAKASAEAAGEPEPQPEPPPPVNRSVTRVPMTQIAPGNVPVCCDVPACFECFIGLRQAAAARSAQGPAKPPSVLLVDALGNPLMVR